MTPTERLDKFNMHHEKIAKIIVGCIGVKSRQVHWKEVAPMIAAYVNSACDKVRNHAIEDCKSILKNQTVDRSRVITVNDLLNEMESLKTIS